MTLLKWALVFLVVSIIAGLLGFTGISAASADIARFLFYVFVVIFLVLAAQFDSFRDPLVILVSVPLSIFGALLPLWFGFATLNIFTQIGLVTLVGLIAKHGILMTAFAFILGVVPLAIATGASMNSQRAIGTGVLGGMVTATVLAVFVTPLFYVLIASIFRSRKASQPQDRDEHAVPADAPCNPASSVG